MTGRIAKGEILDKVYSLTGTPFIRLFESTKGYTALLTDEDAGKIMRSENVEKLKREGLEILPPPDFKTKRSVFVRGLDPMAGGHTAGDTKEELERCNEWMCVDEVIKIKNYTHVMKVVLKDLDVCERVLKEGFVLFNMRVSPDQLKREVFVPLLACFVCFKYEEHPTHQCPEKGRALRCSECAEEGHGWRDCRAGFKKCVNCGGPHRTMAMACPVKKRAIEEKKKAMEVVASPAVAGGRSFAAVASAAPVSCPQVTREEQLKIATIVAHSVQFEQRNPGQYERELNRMLEANGFPALKFPGRVTLAERGREDSRMSGMSARSEQSEQGFISDGLEDQPAITISHSREPGGGNVTSAQYKPAPAVPAPAVVQRKGSTGSTGSRQEAQFSTRNLIPVPDQKRRLYKAEASGIRLFVSRDMGRVAPSFEELKGLMHRGVVKFEHSLGCTDDEAFRLISSGHVAITRDSIVCVDPAAFRKKRNGNPRRTTPPEAKSARVVSD